MVRSYWIGPLFGALAMTGLAQGQTPTPTVPAKASDSQERYVAVGDLGKPGQKCRVLKTWTMSNGHSAYQVQALDTGELITIEESDSAAKPTRIFHGAAALELRRPAVRNRPLTRSSSRSRRRFIPNRLQRRLSRPRRKRREQMAGRLRRQEAGRRPCRRRREASYALGKGERTDLLSRGDACRQSPAAARVAGGKDHRTDAAATEACNA